MLFGLQIELSISRKGKPKIISSTSKDKTGQGLDTPITNPSPIQREHGVPQRSGSLMTLVSALSSKDSTQSQYEIFTKCLFEACGNGDYLRFCSLTENKPLAELPRERIGTYTSTEHKESKSGMKNRSVL